MLTAESWMPYTGKSKPTSLKLAAEIRRLNKEADLAQVMASCGVFDKGIGSTRLQTFISVYGNKMFLNRTPVAEVRAFAKVTTGCGEVFAENLSKGLRAWYTWVSNSGLGFEPTKPSMNTPKNSSEGRLSGVNVSFTGYRDKDQERWVVENGGNVISFGAKTNVLLYKQGGKESTKLSKAVEKGIKWGTFAQLQLKYS
jgi:hypothetical protein